MGFLRSYGIDRETPESRDYMDPEFRFSLRIPGSWRQTSLVPQFRTTGGRIALTRRAGRCSMCPAALQIRDSDDKIERVERARTFLAQSVPGVVATPLRDVTTEVSGETKCGSRRGVHFAGFPRLISILHKESNTHFNPGMNAHGRD